MATEEQTKLDKLEKRTNELRRLCEDQVKRHRKGRTTSLIVGIVVFALVLIYFSVIAARVKDLVEPKGLSMVLRTRIQQAIPGAKAEVKKTLKDNAPFYADKVEKQIMDYIPVLRATAEIKAAQLVDEVLSTADIHAEASVKNFLIDHKDELDEAAETAKALEGERVAEKLTEICFNEYLLPVLDETLIESVGKDLDTIIAMAGGALESMRDQLLVLQKGENLTKQQELQRRLIKLIIRYLAETHLEDLR